jgi:hypothetical protein
MGLALDNMARLPHLINTKYSYYIVVNELVCQLGLPNFELALLYKGNRPFLPRHYPFYFFDF